MKFNLVRSLGTGLILVMAVPGLAEILVPAKVIQLQIVDHSISLSDYKASAGIVCSYRSGVFWPETKSCGTRTLPAEINDQGQLIIPAVESFDQYKGNQIDNFELNISLGRNDNARDWLFSLDIRGKEAFKNYLAENGVLQILKMKAGEMEYLVAGAPLVGSDLSMNKSATLMASVESPRGTDTGNQISVITPMGELQSFDNQNHGYPKESLADFRTLKIPSAVWAEFSTHPKKMQILSTLTTRQSGVDEHLYRSVIDLKKSTEGLSEIQKIDLQQIR